MKTRDLLIFTAIVMLILMLSNACKKDEPFVPVCNGLTPTYNTGISVVISENCTDAPCHGPNSTNGDFTSYDGMNSVINSGELEKQVLTDMTMPQESATLTETEFVMIRCWVDNDYPEN